MPRHKSRSRIHDPFKEPGEDAEPLDLNDEELREEELVNLLGIGSPAGHRNNASEDFSWEGYLESAWR